MSSSCCSFCGKPARFETSRWHKFCGVVCIGRFQIENGSIALYSNPGEDVDSCEPWLDVVDECMAAFDPQRTPGPSHFSSRMLAALRRYRELGCPALALSLLLAGCGGIAEHDRQPNGITALCVTDCLLFDDGHRACVTLTDPKQLEAEWWWHVEAVESNGPCEPESAR